jgi:CBS domain-containing protein
MKRHQIRHVLVTCDGRLEGIVSQRDLFSMQRDSVQAVTENIRASEGLADLIETAWQIRRLASRLLAQGVAGEQLTRVLSELRGALAERIIADAARRFPLHAPWAWLALGSEGRHEQGLEADQDNALIVGMDSTDQAAMTPYLAFARTVNAGLAACGLPHCEGGIIASNPHWCRTLSASRAAASRWIHNPDPAALLNMRILLDATFGIALIPLSGRLR